ncbi:MAG: radical SAM protein [Candidatus Deferrimicrobiaceae bacterium]
MRIALVNTNRITPPVAPIGLDYVAEALRASGHRPELLDLCWEERWEPAIARFLANGEFGLVGVTVRNTDDCSFATRESFLPTLSSMVKCIREHTDAPIVLGGVGLSIMPEAVLARCGADAGIWGEGEFTLAEVAGRLEKNQPWNDLPGLVSRSGATWRRNPGVASPLAGLPPMSRGFLDNRRYFREGGQAGIETKRGCPSRCIYCADPVAKGKHVRVRPPGAVADELSRLVSMGIDHIHTCDSEFNIPADHAAGVCREIVRQGLGERLRWYAYCAPVPFTAELADLMRRAGCAGINFGTDSGDDRMLELLGRDFRAEDILRTARLCRDAGISVMFDLLIGAPGETRESIVRTVSLMKQAEPDCAGVAVGVRVYPGTELANQVAKGDCKKGLTGGDDLADPVFFLEPEVAPFVFGLLDDLTKDDRRFLFFDPTRPERNYNYNANRVLADAIRAGYRGAYWDILRRCPQMRDD